MLEYAATSAAGLWAGAALYIGFAEHPSALKVGVEYATAYFRPMSKRTAPMMMALAGIAAITGGGAWYAGGGGPWLFGAILMLAMFPFTGVLIVPTNLRLLKIDAQASPIEAEKLHAKWSVMHNLRTALGAPAFFIFLWALSTP